MSGNLNEGDLVQFLDSKGRKYPVVLESGKEFHSHSGFVPHADVIGLPEGSKVHTGRGQAYVVMRPTLSEFILKMPRGAQVIYPKDIGPILMLADIGPGVRVLESGVGSGALSMAMLRAGAEIIGYELREDFANRARSNVEQFLGAAALERYHVELRDCYDGIDAEDIDRVVLDLPEPWQVVQHAERAMRPGGHPRRLHPERHPGEPAPRGAVRVPASSPRRPSRCSSAAGTSRATRCARITGWWGTPASSPTPGSARAEWRVVAAPPGSVGERSGPGC